MCIEEAEYNNESIQWEVVQSSNKISMIHLNNVVPKYRLPSQLTKQIAGPNQKTTGNEVKEVDYRASVF